MERDGGNNAATSGTEAVLKNFERGAGEAQDRQAKRDLTFNECGIEAKLMRVRDAVLSLAVMAERAHHQANEANRIAKVHDHGFGGQVVVPIDDGNRAMGLLADVETPFRRINRLLG